MTRSSSIDLGAGCARPLAVLAHSGRRVRSILAIGTCLSGSAAALLLATPAQAQAVRAPAAIARVASLGLSRNLPVLGSPRTAAAPAIDPTRVVPEANAVAPAPSPAAAAIPSGPDYDHGTGTISGDDVVVRVGSITTQNPNERGIDTVATGTTTITADSVVTSGDFAGAIHADGNGDIVIDAATVTTSGFLAHGIEANNRVYGAQGGITIRAGDVRTSGYVSNGIWAGAYGGSVSITANSVSVAGKYGTAVYGVSQLGNVTIDVATVASAGQGIITNSAGTTDITTDSVETSGTGIGAVGGKVVVHAGSVTTTGDNAVGVGAQGNSSVTVDVGTIHTSGYNSAGVDASNTGGANIFVNFDGIATDGDSSAGLKALAQASIIIVGGGEIATHGDNSAGMAIQNLFGGTSLRVDRITTSGDHSNGLMSFSNEAYNDIKIGNISTQGLDSTGVLAVTAGRGVKAYVDVGNIDTHGDYSIGIAAYGYGRNNQLNINSDLIVTSGVNSDGISAKNYAVAGGISITAGTIATLNQKSLGIYAYAYDGDVSITGDSINGGGIWVRGSYSDIDIHANAVNVNHDHFDGIRALSNQGKVNIEVGSLNSDAYYSQGIYGQGKSVHITADRVTTSGEHSRAVLASAIDEAIVDVGMVVTRSDWSPGAIANGKLAQVTIGDAETYGAYSFGVVAISGVPLFPGVVPALDPSRYAEISVSGSVKTHGYGSTGISASSDGALAVHVGGAVTTYGEGSVGIKTNSFNGQVIDGGAEVHTSGDYSSAVFTYSKGGAITISVDTVSTLGAASAGIYARALDHDGSGMNGVIDIDVKNVTTAGKQGIGIYAVNSTPGGAVLIKADNVATGGYKAVGALGVSITSDVSIDVASVATAGAKAAGVYAYSTFGNTKVTVGDANTTGDDADGLVAIGGGTLVTSTGDVTTTGDRSAGIYAVGLQRGATVIANNVSTAGDDASAIRGNSFLAGLTITTNGKISTIGAGSHGAYAFGDGPLSITNNGSVSTTGEASHGIFESASSIAHSALTVVNKGSIATTGSNTDAIRLLSNGGNIDITSSGTISTTGDDSAGIVAIIAPVVPPAPPITTPTVPLGGKVAEVVSGVPGRSGSALLSVNAAAVDVAGAGVTGIAAVNNQGDVNITASKLTAHGTGVTGIDVTAVYGSATIAVGSLDSDGRGIVSAARDGNSVSVTGSVVTPNRVAIDLTSSGGASTLTLAKGATVIGGGLLDPADAKSGNTIVLGGHSGALVNNAGSIGNAGNGFAIFVADGDTGASITNSGRIEGAVRLTGVADRFVNSGSFVVTKDSDFGSGDDVFVNTGTLTISAAALPQGVQASQAAAGHSVTLLGLETFQNSGGIIDLRNGVPGETLTLPGGYVGSGNARLGLDVGNGKADRLVIGGATTGSTTIVLNADANTATLLAQSTALVQAGAGSSANAFTLANTKVGLIEYGVAFDAASGGYRLTSQAGAPVRRLTKLDEGAREIWKQSAAVATAHLTQLRDAGAGGRALWGQTFGGVVNHDGSGGATELAYRQSFYGGQIGLDLGDWKGASFGLTGGYLNSRQNFKGSPTRATFDTVDFGAYGSLRSGVFFGNLLAQFDHSWIKVKEGTPGATWSDNVSGNSFGAQAEIGARLERGKLFIEPVATLAWQHSNIGSITALGQAIDPDSGSAVSGKLGARLGGNVRLGGLDAVFYARGNYVHAFGDGNGLTFESGGTSQSVAGARADDHGEAALGVNIVTKGAWSGFLQGDAAFGGGRSGGGGRAGLRFSF